MTLEELKKMDRDMISPAIASEFLHCNPHYIRLEARAYPCRLGFPTACIGNRVKIPRLAFIRFLEGKKHV